MSVERENQLKVFFGTIDWRTSLVVDCLEIVVGRVERESKEYFFLLHRDAMVDNENVLNSGAATGG